MLSSSNPSNVYSIDAVFHEYTIYFSFKSELQREYHQEIQTLDYDHISKEGESEQSEQVNQEMGELDLTGLTLEPSGNEQPEAKDMTKKERDSVTQPPPSFKQFGSKDAFIDKPSQSSTAEGVLNLESEPSKK